MTCRLGRMLTMEPPRPGYQRVRYKLAPLQLPSIGKTYLVQYILSSRGEKWFKHLINVHLDCKYKYYLNKVRGGDRAWLWQPRCWPLCVSIYSIDIIILWQWYDTIDLNDFGRADLITAPATTPRWSGRTPRSWAAAWSTTRWSYNHIHRYYGWILAAVQDSTWYKTLVICNYRRAGNFIGWHLLA